MREHGPATACRRCHWGRRDVDSEGTSARRSSIVHDVATSPQRRSLYESRGLWNADTLAGAAEHWVSTSPHAVAVVTASQAGTGRARTTYLQLWHDAGALAAHLRDRGVGTHDVVSVQLPNCYQAVVAAVAVARLGAVINPLLPNYRARELTHVFLTARPRVIITPDTYRGFDHRALVDHVTTVTKTTIEHVVMADPGDPDAAGTGAGVGLGGELGQILARGHRSSGAGPTGERAPVSASAVSELIFTSGTEAVPKAIMHTEQTTNAAMRAAKAHLGIGDSDVVWMPSPVGHSTGFNYGLRFALYHGLPLVLQDTWDPERALDLVRGERATYTLAATTFLQDLVAQARRRRVKLDTLRCFGCGGAPVPPDLAEAAIEEGIGVLRLYGSTEVLVGTWNTPGSSLRQRVHTDGIALPHTEIGVLDGENVVPAGVRGEALEGELVVRGPSTSVGLFADPERTAATYLDGGWVRSGDLVTIDADGYLTVVGRKKEIIIRGGMNITPREIEDLVVRFPEVHRVAVVGRPDARLGERSCACVVLEPGRSLDLATMVARLRSDGLATYKLPEELAIVEALPTTASGKVQKHELVRILAERDGGRDGDRRDGAEASSP